MISDKSSSSAISVLSYLACYQKKDCLVTEVRVDEIKEGLCDIYKKSAIYNAIHFLNDKGYITINHEDKEKGYWRIQILNNEIRYGEKGQPRYINMFRAYIQCPQFHKLPAKAKILVLFVHSWTDAANAKEYKNAGRHLPLKTMSRKNFLANMEEKLEVSQRTIYNYIKNYLPQFFRVTKKNGNITFFAIPDEKFASDIVKPKIEKVTQELSHCIRDVKITLRRNKVEATKKEIIETSKLAIQYRNFFDKNIELTLESLRKVIQHIFDTYGKELKPKLVHKTFRALYPRTRFFSG